MLIAMREDGDPPPPYDEVVSPDKISVYVEMSRILDDASLAAIEELGVTFHREGDEVVHVGTIYSADAAWEALHALAGRGEVLTIESSWKPGVLPPG